MHISEDNRKKKRAQKVLDKLVSLGYNELINNGIGN